jgi:hypothetical protein
MNNNDGIPLEVLEKPDIITGAVKENINRQLWSGVFDILDMIILQFANIIAIFVGLKYIIRFINGCTSNSDMGTCPMENTPLTDRKV